MESRYRIHNIKDKKRNGYYYLPQVFMGGKWMYMICNHADGGGTGTVKDTVVKNIYFAKRLKDFQQIGTKSEEFAKKIISHHKECYRLDPLEFTYIE